MLMSGVRTWNQWRESNPELEPDLSEANLRKAELMGANLRKADLNRTDLSRAVLIRADLSRTDLGRADLSKAQLLGANLVEANLFGANLAGANLHRGNLSGAYFIEVNLKKAHLSRASLDGASLNESNLSQANLIKAELSRANLSRTTLTGTDFRRANLYQAILDEADLRKANLQEVNLSRTSLVGVNLSQANLSRANLSEANINGADLSLANLSRALLGRTVLENIDLREVKGLDAVNHQGPSILGLTTLYRSQGKIPQVFLQGVGVPDSFIDFLSYLPNPPLQFYSCFISYSSKDEIFARRLHADLQSQGVRCWYAPEDMRIGDKIRPTIDQYIRGHDKLLLILSEHSIYSDWVEMEVETAFEEEHQRHQTVLFPVRLDEAVMETDQTWAAEIRRTRHIGNFSQWQHPASYQRALKRLLRDLKAES